MSTDFLAFSSKDLTPEAAMSVFICCTKSASDILIAVPTFMRSASSKLDALRANLWGRASKFGRRHNFRVKGRSHRSVRANFFQVSLHFPAWCTRFGIFRNILATVPNARTGANNIPKQTGIVIQARKFLQKSNKNVRARHLWLVFRDEIGAIAARHFATVIAVNDFMKVAKKLSDLDFSPLALDVR